MCPCWAVAPPGLGHPLAQGEGSFAAQSGTLEGAWAVARRREGSASRLAPSSHCGLPTLTQVTVGSIRSPSSEIAPPAAQASGCPLDGDSGSGFHISAHGTSSWASQSLQAEARVSVHLPDTFGPLRLSGFQLRGFFRGLFGFKASRA